MMTIAHFDGISAQVQAFRLYHPENMVGQRFLDKGRNRLSDVLQGYRDDGESCIDQVPKCLRAEYFFMYGKLIA